MEYFAFQWHITDSCDQRCRHCYIFSENNHIRIKEMSWPEIESVFGSTMSNLILNKAKIKVSSENKDTDELSKCRLFIEHLGKDDKLIAMWGRLEVLERISKWMQYIN